MNKKADEILKKIGRSLLGELVDSLKEEYPIIENILGINKEDPGDQQDSTHPPPEPDIIDIDFEEIEDDTKKRKTDKTKSRDIS